jgi:hypothetical protein
MNWCVYAVGFGDGLVQSRAGKPNAMARRKKDSPWHLKVTWTLSIVMLALIAGFFYQSFQEMLKIAPVQVAVERISEPGNEPQKTDSAAGDTDDKPR